MKRICFLIPDGVGIRNYLYSDILRDLKSEGFELTVWHGLDPKIIDQSQLRIGFRPESFPLATFKEDAVTQLFRESTCYARLLRGQEITSNPTILSNWHNGKFSFQKKMLIKLSELLGGTFWKYENILQTEKLLVSRLRGSQAYKIYKKQLSEIKPDVLFCTHQRMPAATPAMLAASDLGIKTVTAIFSWDNLPKARLAIRPDYYLVWSEYMAKELQFFYPEIKEDQIRVTGTPQFDFYTKTDDIMSREEFAAEFGLDPEKKWVCFSGDDAKTSPHDSSYLRDVAEALADQQDIQLIFRQVPVETTARYSKVLEDFPKVVHINPFWEKGKYWQQFFPYPKDVSHLVNLAYHCATVINIGSTMALDFALFDHPGLFLKYDHEKNQEWKTETVYRFQHFKSMDGLDAVGWINSKDEILTKVRLAIDHPDKIATDRQVWLKKITVDPRVQPASNRILQELQNLI